MTGDLIAYLSGNIPGGIYLLLVGIFAFALIWWLVWWGTKFWGIGRFFQGLAIGWIVIIGIYFVAWKRSHPAPLPIRVVVVADDSINPPDKWKLTGLVDIIERRLSASPEHFVLQHTSFTPLLTRHGFSEERFDSLAFILKARWLIAVIPHDSSIDRGMSIKVKRRTASGFELLEELSSNGSQFSLEAAKTAGQVMRLLGDDAPPSGRYGLPPDLPDEAFADLYTAMDLREAQAYDTAAAVLTSLTKTYPEWHRPYQELAVTLIGHNSSYHKEAIHSVLITALELDPSDPESYILLGRYFLRFRDWIEAESALKLALNLTVDDPRVFYFLSRLWRGRLKDLPYGDKDELKYHALKLAPGYETARLALAESYREQLDRHTSLAVLGEGLALDPESVPLLLAKAANLVEMEHNDDAVATCEKILALRPGHTSALYNLGITRIYQGLYDEAIVLLDSSYRNGGTIENLYYIGVAYQKKRYWQTAVHYFQMRMVRPQNANDPVSISARERIQNLQRWIAEEDSLKGG